MYKVLIVDDEPFILEGLKYVIDWEEHGLEIAATAKNGAAALDILQSTPIDILITDIRMPKMDGLDLIRTIKSRSINVKTIILSGYTEFEYAREAIRLGIENYILKPIQEDELSSTLLATIEKIEAASNGKAESSKQHQKVPVFSPLLSKVISYIDAHYNEEISLKTLAFTFDINPAYLGQQFKKEIGQMFNNYLNSLRIEKAKEILLNTETKANEIGEMVGYTTPNYFYNIFKKYTGVYPTEYKKIHT